jgi:uncharacterized protein (TIGR02271 family)
MGDAQRLIFRGEGGLTGWVDEGLPVIDGMSEPHTYVYLEDGQRVPVAISRLRQDPDGGYSLVTVAQPAAVDQTVVESAPVRNPLEEAPAAAANDRVRVTKLVEEQKHVVAEPVLREDVVVERIPIGKIVDEIPLTREENGTVIFPVVEEVLVVEKRYLLKEEVRVTRTQVTSADERVFTTLTEQAVVEPTNAPVSTGGLPNAFQPASVVIGPNETVVD